MAKSAREKLLDKIARMPITNRLAKAKEKLQWMVDELIQLIALHENNAFITYSPLLVKQIPKSFAANAFNVVQESVHRFEVVRICTFWDGVDLDKANIPTVIELVDDPSVIDKVAGETELAWTDIGFPHITPHQDPNADAEILKSLRARHEKAAKTRGVRAKTTLQQAIKLGRATSLSPKVHSVMNLRDKLAHRLSVTRREKKAAKDNKADVRSMKYGDERDLLDTTIKVIWGLHCSINGTDFDWDESRRIARKNAAALWEGCTFDVLQ